MSVEFLPAEDAGDEPPPSHKPTRPRLLWAALAVVLVVGAVVFAETRRGIMSTSTVTPTHAASKAPDPACAGVPDCSVRKDVTDSIAQLARTYLPRGVRLQVHTVVADNSLTHGTQLVERDVEALVDSVRILIRVQRGGSATQALVPDPPGVGSLLLHQVNSGFEVRLQYLAPATVAPSADRLQAMIRDPRLTTA